MTQRICSSPTLTVCSSRSSPTAPAGIPRRARQGGDAMRSSSIAPGKIHLPLFALLLMTARLPAFAEIDLTGSWASVSQGDDILLLADYTGIPYNEAGRAKALSY